MFRSTAASKTGRSVTHFGRAMYELNIDTFCANSSPANGRVERAHLTLQDRLVKELRLRGHLGGVPRSRRCFDRTLCGTGWVCQGKCSIWLA